MRFQKKVIATDAQFKADLLDKLNQWKKETSTPEGFQKAMLKIRQEEEEEEEEFYAQLKQVTLEIKELVYAMLSYHSHTEREPGTECFLEEKWEKPHLKQIYQEGKKDGTLITKTKRILTNVNIYAYLIRGLHMKVSAIGSTGKEEIISVINWHTLGENSKSALVRRSTMNIPKIAAFISGLQATLYPERDKTYLRIVTDVLFSYFLDTQKKHSISGQMLGHAIAYRVNRRISKGLKDPDEYAITLMKGILQKRPRLRHRDIWLTIAGGYFMVRGTEYFHHEMIRKAKRFVQAYETVFAEP